MEQQVKKAGGEADRRLRVAIAGFGTVGSAVARILSEQGGGSPFELTYILNRRIAAKRSRCARSTASTKPWPPSRKP